MGHTYVVFNGHVPGIYESWLDVNRQVHKFPNANHKSYKDRREAKATYMEHLLIMVWTCRVVCLHQGEVKTCPPQVHQAHLEVKEPTIQVKTLGTPC